MDQTSNFIFGEKYFFTLQMEPAAPTLALIPPFFFGLLFTILGILYHLNPSPKIANWHLDLSFGNVLRLFGVITFSFFIFLLLISFFRVFYKNFLNQPPPLVNHKFNATTLPYYPLFVAISVLLPQPLSVSDAFILEVIIFVLSIHFLSNFCANLFYKIETRFYAINDALFALTSIRYPYIGLFYKQKYYWCPDQNNCLNFTITQFISRKKKILEREVMEYHFLTLGEAEKQKNIHNDFLLSLYDTRIVPANKQKGVGIKSHITYEETVDILNVLGGKGKCAIIKLNIDGTIKGGYLGIEYEQNAKSG